MVTSINRRPISRPSCPARPSASCRPRSATPPPSPRARFVGQRRLRPVGPDGQRADPDRNRRYWAGPAPIGDRPLLTTLAGNSPVEAFEAGTVDYTGIDDVDATWLRYDSSLGPQLRSVPSLERHVLRVRRSPEAVRRRSGPAGVRSGRRLDPDREPANSGSLAPATSMVPPGIPGRSSTTSCRLTIPRPPARSWPRRASRAEPACPR